MSLDLKDPKMGNIDVARHADSVDADAMRGETIYNFSTDGWKMEVTSKNTKLSVSRVKADYIPRYGYPSRAPEVPTKKRRIV